MSSSLPFTFQGERGGKAEDAELLAELLAISQKASSSNRFVSPNDEKDDVGDSRDANVPETKPEPKPAPKPTAVSRSNASKPDPGNLPPWKRKSKMKPASGMSNDIDMVVAAPKPKNNTANHPPVQVQVAQKIPQDIHRDEQLSNTAGSIASELPFTFKGDRGGTAEDSELLAELLAISAKSSSAKKFDQPEEFNNNNTAQQVESILEVPSARQEPKARAKKSAEIPPWKRKKKPVTTPPMNESVDVVVASPPHPSREEDPVLQPQPATGIQASLPFTFNGDRGGTAEDADLLAELRAISQKSSSADRFSSQDNQEIQETQIAEPKPQPKPKPKPPVDLPPWKQKKMVKKPTNDKVDVFISEPPAEPMAPESSRSNDGIKSDLPFTFKGDRGGSAEDADLLAELRAISSQSSNTNRFASNETKSTDVPSEESQSVINHNVPQSKGVSVSSGDVPPWKRKNKQKPKQKEEDDVVITTGDRLTNTSTTDKVPEASLNIQNGIKSSLPSTFKGERGGAAEDADLLAELRAVSAQSKGEDRFASQEDDGQQISIEQSLPDKEQSRSNKGEGGASVLPPWKRKKTQKSKQVSQSIDVAVPKQTLSSAPQDLPNSVPSKGTKSSLPFTFKGDRGGTAEDADLLAELQAVSSKSSNVDRFSAVDDGASNENEHLGAPTLEAKNSNKSLQTYATKGVVSQMSPERKPENTEPTEGIKSELPFTFKGERGGSAEDADLLAELRAISSGASGTGRFSSTEETEASPPPQAQPMPRPKPTDIAPPVPVATSSPFPTSAPNANEEIVVTRETLEASIADKNWKLRKASYDLLRQIIREQITAGSQPGNIDSDSSIMPGLSQAILSVVYDSNASALDSGLQLALDYSENCSQATDSEHAGKIATCLLKGNGLSSSRPSTVKYSSAVLLKLMEVGSEGASSVHEVICVLLEKGLTSRKPKIVIASSSIICDATLDFGAINLPLASIRSSMPKLISHSNVKAREMGMKIVAEICNAFGSKAPLQELLDSMKKAQQSQLDKILSSLEGPSPPRVGLRSSQGEEQGDAMEVLEAQAKALEAERFANRSAVNIFVELAKTNYTERLKLPKWSEKVGALDTLLECGGEKPFKLVQPSANANYAPLVSEMKKILGHTHFAVVSKAMEVYSMLAEGVGEKLFPFLRPLLTTIVQLAKDKKLTRAVSSCLDCLYGNVLSLDHLLDKDDSLPSQLDERSQKNALARVSTLEYLRRCIERGESSGKRGKLTSKNVEGTAKLAATKLGDTDANVRKAATSLFKALMTLEEKPLAVVVDEVLESLSSSNPRAYKTLRGSNVAKASSSRTPNDQDIPASKPSKPPTKNNPIPSKLEKKGIEHVQKDKARVQATTAPSQSQASGTQPMPGADEAITTIAGMGIELWDANEDDGGVLSGLKSSKWSSRQKAILSIVNHCEQLETVTADIPSSILLLVKNFTKGFKESNFNIMKAIMTLASVLCDKLADSNLALPDWIGQDLVAIATEKVSDRKLGVDSQSLLLNVCVVKVPSTVLEISSERLEKVRAPAVHETFMKWLGTFCNEFGCKTLLTRDPKPLIAFLLKECDSSNVKVRGAALAVLGEFHCQAGPSFRAICLSMCNDAQRKSIEATFEKFPFDKGAAEQERPRRCILFSDGSTLNGSGETGAMSSMEIPKMDLAAEVGKDCIVKLGAKEGKTAWKLRKEALDEIDVALKKCSGLLESSGPQLKALIELLRGVRDRLSDSQSNLKPVAARLIGNILGKVEKTTQGKLGKVVYSPLINAAINDNRKPMREASMEALKIGTSSSELEGGQPNDNALEALLVAFVGELGDSEFKSVGLPELQLYIASVAEYLPNIDSILAARGQPLGDKFSIVMVKCFTSSKSEIRSAAETMLKACIDAEAISGKTVRKGLEKLKPAQQRTVSPLISKMLGTATKSPKTEKENLPEKREIPRGRAPKSSPTTPQGRIAPSRPRSSSSRSVVNRSVKPIIDNDFDELDDVLAGSAQSGHPLAGSTGMKGKRANRAITWPEYPEEPTSSNQFLSLKKAWSSMVPLKSISSLFPSGGLKKQDDARLGCNLLMEAIRLDRQDGTTFVADQIDLILKWISAALCLRENTVGLQLLLDLQLDLFKALGEHENVLTDQESMSLVPFIFERGSVAKGRFKELFDEVLETMSSMSVIAVKCFGSVVCAAVIEKSSQPKARVMAYNHCMRFVENIGLNGIGKRGLLMTTKRVSEESLPENKAAALNLIMVILSKMNGDIDRLARMCGTSYLSEKAKDLIEEQWRKKGHVTPEEEKQSTSNLTSSAEERKLQIPTTRKVSRTSSDRLRTLQGLQQRNAAIGASNSDDEVEESSGVASQRTPFALRLGAHSTTTRSASSVEPDSPNAGPFTFSFESSIRHSESTRIPLSSHTERRAIQNVTNSSMNEKPPLQSSIPTGAAASLRARLMKIRQKHIARDTDNKEAPQEERPVKETERNLKPTSDSVTSNLNVSPETAPLEHGNLYDSAISSFEKLCSIPGTISDDQSEVQSCINYLRQFHTSCKDARDDDSLRRAILNDVAGTVTHLTSIIHFAFSKGVPTQNAGMAVTLLSVVLATLMALFRDSMLARLVTQDDLALLIKETGKCLLDPRLAVSATHASGLDESTSSQMVRGMNKLAVHAATGTSRHTSLQALLVLQEQLCLFEAPTPAETSLNGRLSRIITKLFAKVVKAEQSDLDPFSPTSVDLSSIFCCLEDVLATVKDRQTNDSGLREGSLATCSSMATSLIKAISSARAVDELRKQLHLVDLCGEMSNVFLTLKSIVPEISDDEARSEPMHQPQESITLPPKESFEDVTALVSAVGSAPEGHERTKAIDALKRFLEQHGNSELNAHLEEISPTFRAYIVEQLGSAPSSVTTNSPSTNSKLALPMSERIKKLRSKINVLDPGSTETNNDPAQPTISYANTSTGSGHHSPLKISRTSGLPQASPSQIASVSSLRQRLAAAQENRSSKTSIEIDNPPKQSVIAAPSASTSGNAAALRARLQAMKNQNKQLS